MMTIAVVDIVGVVLVIIILIIIAILVRPFQPLFLLRSMTSQDVESATVTLREMGDTPTMLHCFSVSQWARRRISVIESKLCDSAKDFVDAQWSS
jgi:hypothetical protein